MKEVLKALDDAANAIQDPDYYKKELEKLRLEYEKLKEKLREYNIFNTTNIKLEPFNPRERFFEYWNKLTDEEKERNVGEIKNCPECKKIVKTTCTACGCGSCIECGYRFSCLPPMLWRNGNWEYL